MSAFIEIRALAGTNFVRAGEVIAVQYSDPLKCIVMMAGGATLSCAEPAAQVRARIEAALGAPIDIPLSPQGETPDGDASR